MTRNPVVPEGAKTPPPPKPTEPPGEPARHEDRPRTVDVDEASEESFPASDPPSFTPERLS